MSTNNKPPEQPVETLDPHDKRYVSLIPTGAVERLIWQSDDSLSREAEYVVDGKVIGSRRWDSDGQLTQECCHIEGSMHERRWDWYEEGHLTFAESLLSGVPHGLSIQFSNSGKVLGTFTMIHGTGVDLWWQEGNDGTRYLSEVLYLVNGRRHGFSWWINEDQRTVYIERYWHNGERHGVEREWQADGSLSPGYPKFFAKGKEVPFLEYVELALHDPSLRPFSEQENVAIREFPQEILKHMAPLAR